MFFSLALLAAGAAASPVQHHQSSYAVKEAHHVPQQWTRIGDAPSNHLINLQIGLKQGQFEDLEQHLWEGKTPQVFVYIN